MIEFAIVDSNTLSCMGLQHLLKELIPVADVAVFHSFEELVYNEPERYTHYFVASGIYFEHSQFFISQPHRSIVLVHGNAYPHLAGLLTLNVCQDEQAIVTSLLRLQRQGHPTPLTQKQPPHALLAQKAQNAAPLLSQREIEVAVLLAKGLATKEVADRLSISFNTATVHRRNIMEKLKGRSLADIIVYVVRNGLIELDEL